MVMYALEEGKVRRLYLLSYDVGIVAGLDFEGAVVRPQVNGIGDACNTALVDLRMSVLSHASYNAKLPFPRLPSQLSRTRGPRIFSSNRRTMEIWRGSGRRHCALR